MRTTCKNMNGSTKNATKFGWPLACEIMAGANPQNPAPTAAATLERTETPVSTCRENAQYQAMAVPPRPAVSPIAYVAVGPKISVIGANGMLMPNIAVLAIRFTPSG